MAVINNAKHHVAQHCTVQCTVYNNTGCKAVSNIRHAAYQ
jgi:hypothetical protein